MIAPVSPVIPTLNPYPAYKDSGVPWLGEVPEHWAISRLKTQLVGNDAGVWSDEVDDAGTPVLRSTEQTIEGGWRITAPARLRLSAAQRESATLVEGDLVVTKSSGSSAHIGKTSLVTAQVAAMGCCFSNFMQRLRFADGAVPALVSRILNSPVGREQMVFQSTTTTGLGNLNGKILGNCIVALPPLPEQAAIVRFLDHMDRRIRRYIRAKQKLIKLLEEEKQAIIHRAVTGQVDVRTGQPYPAYKPSGVEWLGDVPAGWEVRPAKYFYREVDERSASGEEELLSVSHITGVTRRSEKSITMFMAESYVGQKVCRPDDLVINTMWAWMGALGVSALQGIVSSSYGVYRPIARSPLSPRFADLLLRLPPYVDEYTCRSTGITSSRLRLYPDKFLGIPMVCPSPPEQDQILRYVAVETAEAQRAVESVRRQISLLQEYRTRLIADVVTGKLDVREAAALLPDEPDEADTLEEEEPLDEAAEPDEDAEAEDAEA